MKPIQLSVTRSLLIAASALTLSICISSCTDESVAPRYPTSGYVAPHISSDTTRIHLLNPGEVSLPVSVEL